MKRNEKRRVETEKQRRGREGGREGVQPDNCQENRKLHGQKQMEWDGITTADIDTQHSIISHLYSVQ